MLEGVLKVILDDFMPTFGSVDLRADGVCWGIELDDCGVLAGFIPELDTERLGGSRMHASVIGDMARKLQPSAGSSPAAVLLCGGPRKEGPQTLETSLSH